MNWGFLKIFIRGNSDHSNFLLTAQNIQHVLLHKKEKPKNEQFAKIVNGFQQLTIFTKNSTLD